jgi:predicted AlkP superfamily pyrophosphatase or phosphodiesterase
MPHASRSIVPALFGRVDDAWIPETARSADAVVLLVLDGLGWSALQDHAPLMPRLAGMDGDAITTVAPSTTATALTSIATGLAPAQHGIVGYRMLVGDEVLNVLRWSASNRGPRAGTERRPALRAVPRPGSARS